MRKLILLYSICIALFTACGNSVVSPEQIEKYPSIYPDYIGVTIPATIAPMNFSYTDTSYERIDVIVKRVPRQRGAYKREACQFLGKRVETTAHLQSRR